MTSNGIQSQLEPQVLHLISLSFCDNQISKGRNLLCSNQTLSEKVAHSRGCYPHQIADLTVDFFRFTPGNNLHVQDQRNLSHVAHYPCAPHES